MLWPHQVSGWCANDPLNNEVIQAKKIYALSEHCLCATAEAAGDNMNVSVPGTSHMQPIYLYTLQQNGGASMTNQH